MMRGLVMFIITMLISFMPLYASAYIICESNPWAPGSSHNVSASNGEGKNGIAQDTYAYTFSILPELGDTEAILVEFDFYAYATAFTFIDPDHVITANTFADSYALVEIEIHSTGQQDQLYYCPESGFAHSSPTSSLTDCADIEISDQVFINMNTDVQYSVNLHYNATLEAWADIEDWSKAEFFMCPTFLGVQAVTAIPVPEPGTMLLLGSSALGFAGFRFKFKRV